MIIRRRKTKHFVQLENGLVRDTGLTLDEHGMLHYLLSLPDDWEVSRHNCANYWGIGRDKAARIFRSLRKRGWARVERVHSKDGTFLEVRWIITDDPGEPVPDSILDVEESGAEIDSLPGPHSTAPSEVPPVPDHDSPCPCSGSPGERVTRDTGSTSRGNIDSKKTETYENRDPQTPAATSQRKTDMSLPKVRRAFRELVKVWPPEMNLSQSTAEAEWRQLSEVERGYCCDCAQRYLDECQQRSRKICALTTFIREKRFERFASSTKESSPTIELKPFSPEWSAWRNWKEARGENVRFMETQAQAGASWWAPTFWPPNGGPVTQDPGGRVAAS